MGRAETTSTILIADAHVLFRKGLRTLLSGAEGLEVVEEASDLDEALTKVRTLTPDALIMDLGLLRTDLRNSTKTIRQTSTALLCLTREDEEQELELAIEAGAQGYMRRDTPPVQMIAAVRRVVRSGGDWGPHGLSRMVPDLQALARTGENYQKGPVLTSREQEVVRLLAEGKTVRQVASDLSLSMKTIEAHKLNLMRKLDIHNRASLVQYALHSGLAAAESAQ